MTFDQSQDDRDHAAFVQAEVAQSIGTGVGAALALTGIPVLGALAAVAAGLASIISTALLVPVDQTFKDLATYEEYFGSTIYLILEWVANAM